MGDSMSIWSPYWHLGEDTIMSLVGGHFRIWECVTLSAHGPHHANVTMIPIYGAFSSTFRVMISTQTHWCCRTSTERNGCQKQNLKAEWRFRLSCMAPQVLQCQTFTTMWLKALEMIALRLSFHYCGLMLRRFYLPPPIIRFCHMQMVKW